MAFSQEGNRSPPPGQVIPVKGHIQSSDGRGDAFKGDDQISQSPGEKVPPFEDSHQIKIVRTLIFFQDLMGHPPEDTIDSGSIKENSG